MCRVYLCQASMGKSSEKIGKTHNYPSFWKVTQLVARALVAIKRKKKLLKVKPQHWHFCIILKRSNNVKAVKTGVIYAESFMLLTISNLRTTAFCFGNIELLKWILNTMSFVIAKKRSSTIQKHFQIQQNLKMVNSRPYLSFHQTCSNGIP